MAVGDIYEVKILSFQGAQLGINIRHYRVASITGAQPSDNAIRDRMDAVFLAQYPNLFGPSTNYLGTTVRKIWPLPVLLETTRAGVSVAGTTLGDNLPKQTAGVITLRTTLAGRSNRGRLYTPFPTEASNDADSTPTAAYLQTLQLLGLLLISSVVVTSGGNSATLDPGIWRRGPKTFTIWSTFLERDKWGTQRRRGDYGRPNLIPV